jgi:hypothetical protein
MCTQWIIDQKLGGASFLPFDRTNERARSHRVIPGAIKIRNPATADGLPPIPNPWFYPFPRCLKCRIIHNYVIDTETTDAMNENAAANFVPYCAEDLVHAKLRLLLPEDRPGAGLEKRGGEEEKKQEG